MTITMHRITFWPPFSAGGGGLEEKKSLFLMERQNSKLGAKV